MNVNAVSLDVNDTEAPAKAVAEHDLVVSLKRKVVRNAHILFLSAT